MANSTQEQRRNWREKNKEHVRDYAIQYESQNKEKRAEWNRRWKLKNRWNGAAHKSAREVHIYKATPLWASAVAIQEFYRRAADLSASTGIQHSVDHIVPLRGKLVCGLHCEANLQVIPLSENCKKSNREWPQN